ncbi:CRAL-TRIO domain-containing protein [Trametes polyzona]|nr:CRAL-TRIO domain-containing protein [Trametes polyzona]
MSAILDALREQQDIFVEAYRRNVDGARAVQRTLTEDILPGLVDELDLQEEDVTKARSWLDDLQSIYRVFRRHKFTVPFALEHARDTLLWRLAVVPSEIPKCDSPFLRCLPLDARDPFGRPVVVVKLAELLDFSGDVRKALIHYMELLRLNLKALNATACDDDSLPVLQYVVLVDLSDVSVKNPQSTDLISWHVLELVPRFPGMLGAMFVLNYSWAHAGVWSIVKRVLPKSVLSRVFFPTPEELVQVIPPSALPQEYGGSLAPLCQLENPLESFTARPPDPLPVSPPMSAPAQLSPNQTIVRVPSISPTSHLNPYFGYPVSGRDAMTPRLRHGRQRKRDLLRTLASLWWSRWKHRVYLLLCIAMAAVMVTSQRRRSRILRWKQAVRGLLLGKPSEPK